jgi:hypothetical protein
VTPQRIEVHIDELVLHGFPALDARAVGAAVERELALLVAARPPAPRGADALDAGSFAVPAGRDSGELGAGIASRVGEVLG